MTPHQRAEEAGLHRYPDGRWRDRTTRPRVWREGGVWTRSHAVWCRDRWPEPVAEHRTEDEALHAFADAHGVPR
jgi:hypothetical protein